MSEDTVIRHGAPTLAGMKTGNLFPCFFSSPQALAEELRAMNRVLVPRGLRLVPLRREKGRALLYLFRPAALSRDLAQEEVRRRLGAGGDFPHEIGLFLGYPPEDVAGFVRHRGKGCKCVGYWKVYGDEAAARRQFAAFKACTANYCRRRAKGASLARLAVTTRLPQ